MDGSPLRRGVRRACSIWPDQSGDTLLEVIVAALLVSAIAIGTFAAFDATGRMTADQRHRSQADAIAQQDQDRLRGLQVSDLLTTATNSLTAGNTTRTVSVAEGAGATIYAVKSQSKFVTDSSGSASCSTGGHGSADEIQTTSTITWGGMGNRPPVVAESLITPPAGGSLVVQIADQAGNGVPGMVVTATGTSTGTTNPPPATTGPEGCAVFGGLPGGTYDASVAQAGYVDKDGNSTPPAAQQATTVVNGVSDTISFQFAQAGAISATFTSTYNGGSHASSADQLVAFQTGMSTPSFRVFGTPNTYLATILTPSTMFPFTTPYTVYAGACAADDPHAVYSSITDPAAQVNPGATVPTVLALPSLVVDVWTGTSSATPGSLISTAPHVAITDTGCNVETYPATQVPTNAAVGALVDPGRPYGTYKACADAILSGTRYRNYVGTNASPTLLTLPSSAAATGTTANIYLGSPSRMTGACP
jgi:Tfp pilus assembly protein PilV